MLEDTEREATPEDFKSCFGEKADLAFAVQETVRALIRHHNQNQTKKCDIGGCCDDGPNL